MIKFPLGEFYKQVNIGDRYGDFSASNCLDLSNEQGKIKISPRMVVNFDTTDDAQFDVAPFAIIFNPDEGTGGEWHVGAGEDFFKGGNLPNEAFTEDTTSTNQPNFETTTSPDLAYFNGKTYAMEGELHRLDVGGADWDPITSLTGTNGHPLIPFGATGRLYYRKSLDQMGSIDTAETPVAPTNTYALDLNDERQPISCGKASADFIWLGTVAEVGQKARIHQWNGSSTAVSATYEIDAQAVLAIGIKDNTPWCFDSSGVLRMLNGGQFVERARIPFREGKPLRPLTGSHTTWMCHYNGLAVDKDRILLNLNTTYADGTTDFRAPSGIWEFNERNGLFHRASYGSTKSGGSITDFGAPKISAIGAIAVARTTDSSSNGTILAGATIFTNASSTKVVLSYLDSNDTLRKAGSFITPKIYSNNITDLWQKVYTILDRKFLSATDKVVVKARNEFDEPVEATITFNSSTTQFTVPTSSFTTAPAVGDEIEIIAGAVGAGLCAHITEITTSGSDYVVTIDEVVSGAVAQTAKARFMTWVKLGSYSAQTDNFFKLPFDSSKLGSSPLVQLKFWIVWTGGNAIANIIISNSPQEKIE